MSVVLFLFSLINVENVISLNRQATSKILKIRKCDNDDKQKKKYWLKDLLLSFVSSKVILVGAPLSVIENGNAFLIFILTLNLASVINFAKQHRSDVIQSPKNRPKQNRLH